MQRIFLDGSNWLLGQRSSVISYNGESVDRILVQTDGGELTETFRIVYQEQPVPQTMDPITNFERVDWIGFE